MAPKGKLHVFTVTQARHAFQRSKHILEQRVKVLSEATTTGDAGKIKEAELLVQEAKGIYELRRATLSVAIFNTEKQLTDAKAVVVQQPDNIQPSTSNNIPKPTCNLVAQAPAAQHQDPSSQEQATCSDSSRLGFKIGAAENEDQQVPSSKLA